MRTTLTNKWVWIVAAGLWAATAPAEARTTLKSICRVKGQEENVLHGQGLIVGLKGTGDGANFLPAIRALATALEFMGSPAGKGGIQELRDAKNVALVAVTAVVPASGARQGDKLDCTVSSIGSAKSLAGGRLFWTPMTGPIPKDGRVFAIAEGALTLENAIDVTTGKVFAGCRLEEDFFNPFTKEGKITLVLDRNHADFQVAQEITDLINNQMSIQSSGVPLAKATSAVNIEVSIPAQYREDPVMFVAQVLGLPVMDPPTGARVVINERSGSIVISGDVEIGPVVVTHKNIVVETGTGAAASQFVPLDPSQTDAPRLKALVESLNALHVPPADVIDIIKGLDRNGKLHAQLIIE